ncbi:MAG: 16S rRNA (guanine(966)-N(2))-methyltransferase RsmD [Lachnospiraceae bacterium]|nr:16S rRNA (guanine(966)-N(2))-methyltransferase RsmD [Lachnospiraceae bacterium]
MRVIAGIARRLKLKTLDGLETRPTQDIIKETLFNVIQNEVPGSRFLDLFSGSGAIGIEALSRGAREAYFVENNRKAVKVIEENLEFTKLKDKARVITADVMVALNQIEGSGKFDIIHLDPPYELGLEKNVLKYLMSSELADSETLIIIEASTDTDFSFLEEMGYKITKEKIYKHNRHLFINKYRGIL